MVEKSQATAPLSCLLSGDWCAAIPGAARSRRGCHLSAHLESSLQLQVQLKFHLIVFKHKIFFKKILFTIIIVSNVVLMFRAMCWLLICLHPIMLKPQFTATRWAFILYIWTDLSNSNSKEHFFLNVAGSQVLKEVVYTKDQITWA